MPLDGIFAKHLCLELNQRLQGARVQKIFQPTRFSLSFSLRKDGQAEELSISANPSNPTIGLDFPSVPNPQNPPPFCMLLRKHLIGGEILGVEQPEGERIFRLRILSRDELGDLTEKILVAELMGRHSNLILLRADGIILDAIRHIDHSVNRFREIMPARPYLAPPAQERDSSEELYRKLKENGSSALSWDSNKILEKMLMQSCAGFSPVLAREVAFRADLPSDRPCSSLDSKEQGRVVNAYLEVLKEIIESPAQPALYYRMADDQLPYDFHTIALQHFPKSSKRSSPSKVMRDFDELRGAWDRFVQKKNSLQNKLEKLEKQNARKEELHRGDLREGKKADKYQLYGELVQSKIYALKDKMKSIEVENYYEEGQPLVEIPLDPRLSPAGNVENYFKRYRKAKEKERLAESFLNKDSLEKEWLGSLSVALQRAENLRDLQAIEDEVEANNSREKVDEKTEQHRNDILNPGKPGKRKQKYQVQAKKKKKKEPIVSGDFRSYRSTNGFLIRSGHNNLENERLSFRKAKKSDLWFHARNIPGSHVVLHLEGNSPQAADIEDAAKIAAWFSAANRLGMAGKVEVDYCPAGNITKIKGAKPGMVTYKDFKTVLVEAERPEEMLQSEIDE